MGKLNSLFCNWPPEERTGPGGTGWGRGTPSTKTNLVAVRVMGSLVVKALPSFLGCAVLVFYYCLPQIMKSGEGLPPSSPFAVPRDFLVLGSQVRKVVLSSSTAGLCLAR